MAESIKTWLTQNHIEHHNMIQEVTKFLDGDKDSLTHTNTQMSTEEVSTPKSPTKQDGAHLNLTLAIALEKTFIKPINEAAAKTKDKTLYEERYEHVTTIWNTIVDHMMCEGDFPNYHEWINLYSIVNLMKMFSAHEYTPDCDKK